MPFLTSFLFFFLCAAISAFPLTNLTYYGQWSNFCPNNLRTDSDSTLTFSEVSALNITLLLTNFTEFPEWNCLYYAINSKDMIINGKYVQFSFLKIPRNSQQFFSFDCHPVSYNGSNPIFDLQTHLNMTMMIVNGGALFNFQKMGECAVFFSEKKNFSLHQLEAYDVKAMPCTCQSICLEGTITLDSFSSPVSDFGTISLSADSIRGTYLESANNSLSGKTLDCGVVYVPQYPSSFVIVEYCNAGNESVLNTDFALTFAFNKSVFLGDKSIPMCFSMINQGNLLILNLALLSFWFSLVLKAL